MKYRVVDCSDLTINTIEHDVEAGTPEEAASLALGKRLRRGSAKMGKVQARVYFAKEGGLNMVRLYAFTGD